MSVETALCDLMHYEHCILFPRAREALRAWCDVTGKRIEIPTNCCSALLPFASKLVPIDINTGLAPVPVQLYGYRQEFIGADIEIDSLMTGLLGRPFATSTIISFGYAKTIDIGGGGAILTSDKSLANKLSKFKFFPKVLRAPLAKALYGIHSHIMQLKNDYEDIENKVAALVQRLPARPIIPWRFVARQHNEKLFDHIASWNLKVSYNYPPLPSVTDANAIEWGQKVINIWK